ncbi:MAG: metallophosphoesterase [Candidatus Micrarchaeota archaeon]|nr:metallophosphoesterase [Candidatus Micrarchaeota archaeon]
MEKLEFAYDEPAAIVRHGSESYLVVGDLHIGKELKLSAKGIRIYGTTDQMAERIITLMRRHKANNLILLGDVKDSILRAESVEARLILNFFKRLAGYNIILVQGNHDAGLGDYPGLAKVKEFKLGNIGLIHGNSLPSEEMMRSEFIIAGHDHPAALVGSEGEGRMEKVWVVMQMKYTAAAKLYKNPERKVRLILMPAFNDLISGNDVTRGGRILNPLVRRGLFDFKKAKFYPLGGGGPVRVPKVTPEHGSRHSHA